MLVASLHLLLFGTPGPPLIAASIEPLPTDPYALVDARRAPGGSVLATVAGPAAEHWLLDPAALARLAAGETLAPGDAPRIPATGLVAQLDATVDTLSWVAPGPDGLAAWTWSPPGPPHRQPLPADTLWRTRDGRPIRAADLDPALAKTILAGVLPLVSGDWTVVLLSRADDVAVVPRDDPAAGRVFDTFNRRHFAALPRSGEFAAVHGVDSRLERIRCTREPALEGAPACGFTHDHAAPSTGGPAIDAVDLDPASHTLAICAGASLFLYTFDGAGEATALRGAAGLPGPCDAVLALPGDAALARVAGVWQRIRFTHRGGILR